MKADSRELCQVGYLIVGKINFVGFVVVCSHVVCGIIQLFKLLLEF